MRFPTSTGSTVTCLTLTFNLSASFSFFSFLSAFAAVSFFLLLLPGLFLSFRTGFFVVVVF